MSTYPSDLICKHNKQAGRCDACDAEFEAEFDLWVEGGGNPENLP